MAALVTVTGARLAWPRGSRQIAAMAYYTKVLQPDETVRDVAHLHWSIYLPFAFLLLIAIAVAVLAASVVIGEPQQTYTLYAAAAVAVIALLVGLAEWVRRRSTEIVVTDRRVIYKRGLLSRHTVEMNITRIETVDVIQGIAGRIFNYGTVIIRGTGAGIEPLRGIGAPVRLRNAIIVG
jgi:uncharacterized membrane protein YdbT with pleckstrin-like domain